MKWNYRRFSFSSIISNFYRTSTKSMNFSQIWWFQDDQNQNWHKIASFWIFVDRYKLLRIISDLLKCHPTACFIRMHLNHMHLTPPVELCFIVRKQKFNPALWGDTFTWSNVFRIENISIHFIRLVELWVCSWCHSAYRTAFEKKKIIFTWEKVPAVKAYCLQNGVQNTRWIVIISNVFKCVHELSS